MTNHLNTTDEAVLLAGSAALEAVDAAWDSLDKPELSKDEFAARVLQGAADLARTIRDTPLQLRQGQLAAAVATQQAGGGHV